MWNLAEEYDQLSLRAFKLAWGEAEGGGGGWGMKIVEGGHIRPWLQYRWNPQIEDKFGKLFK